LVGPEGISDAPKRPTIDTIDVPLCLGTIGKLARAGAHPIDGFQEIAKVTGMAEGKARCRHDGGPPEGDIPTPIRLLSIDHAVC